MEIKLNAANLITITRILLVPYFIYTLIISAPYKHSLIILLICIITDGLDGFIARNFKQKTEFGRFLDPIADKLLLLPSYYFLTLRGITPVWLFLIILTKDILVVIGWLLIYVLSGSRKINVRFSGKTAIVFQMITLVLILAKFSYVNILYYVTFILTFIAVIEYIYVGIKHFNAPGQKINIDQ
ncbi:MAG: CDP-alcohol phosphatidyltransferase family protein [Elusimicrobiota bacterium]